ncbi:beta-lactamase family protein [Planotetraspora sp. A-T 1434]|uniref:serine hydrolase domain-containing protein n=1 Tax=Planotetraspora sp. A-T 1434 TaxID=2979219 RepID=UPI0021C1ADCA|nr:serine hydrolase domain-containing protein [Planotetraspora sp. A-T 1434]MCT9931934.1 beta-lactamase family protein [Planotetraspora sp. A-T 1434]
MGTPAIAASAGGTVVTGLGVDHPAPRNYARAHEPHPAKQRNKQRQLERERQRQRQHLLRDITLVVTPAQKGETDSRALPYNWQKADTSANSYNHQDSVSDATSHPTQESHAVTSPARQCDGTAPAMRAYLRDLAAKKKFTGSALVVCRGEVLARFAAGEADEEKHIPNRPDTVFRLASVTKQFTAMLVLKLRDRGLLDLDDPVCPYLVPAYINACPTAWRPITIREILTHTSGIPDIQGLPGFFEKLSQPTTTRELIQRFVNLPLDFAPGTSWKYSSSGFILAGAIIQSVTHKPYGTVLHKLITGPLKLRHTGYSRGNPPDGYAKGYFTLGSAAPPINGSEAFSATGIYSTADDIARWDRAFGAHLVAPPATVKQAFTPQAPCPSNGCLNLPSSAYAFGWLVDRLQGHRLRYHPGLLQGYAASNMYLPDDDIEVVVLSNVQDTDTNGIARHLATMALKS